MLKHDAPAAVSKENTARNCNLSQSQYFIGNNKIMEDSKICVNPEQVRFRL